MRGTMSSNRSVIALIAILLVGACGGGEETASGEMGEDPGGGITTTVVAKDNSFDTAKLEFQPGAEVTVTLENQGEAEHTFSIEELDVEVEAHGGESAETTFTVPDSGTYEFFCEYHPDDMTGTLAVLGSGAGGDDEKENGNGGGTDY